MEGNSVEQRWLSGSAIDLQKMSILAKKIIFSDEAHFGLGGYVNKLNCCIWGTENPYAYAMLNEFLFTKIEEEADAPETSHCLVRILVQRHNWAIFLRK